MSLRILNASVMVEHDTHLHEARLLVLLHHAAEQGDGRIRGITKLAKLDFLLRYPKYLRALVSTVRKRPLSVDMDVFEDNTIESKMIRFKYGPWDHRYRGWLALLYAKGMLTTRLEGNTVCVWLTEDGKKIAKEIAELPEFKTLSRRGNVLMRVAGSLSGTRLKNLVYELVPEIAGMAWGQEIAE